jgi:hypothetical protein
MRVSSLVAGSLATGGCGAQMAGGGLGIVREALIHAAMPWRRKIATPAPEMSWALSTAARRRS